jgi:hypothetical protein
MLINTKKTNRNIITSIMGMISMRGFLAGSSIHLRIRPPSAGFRRPADAGDITLNLLRRNDS